jgi:hypothetical protein
MKYTTGHQPYWFPVLRQANSWESAPGAVRLWSGKKAGSTATL